MFLAVFGDVHGNLVDMYRYCDGWAASQRLRLEAVLQCGDMGMFPPGATLDRASRRHAERDPTELGAEEFISGVKRAGHLTVFVRGNHEDFDFLSRFPYGGFIDPPERIYYLTTSRVFRAGEGCDGCTVAGLGGIAPKGKAKDGWHLGRRYFADWECDELLRLPPGSVDILLTHDAPEGKGLRHRPGTGAIEISMVIEQLQPRLAFFGHYGFPPEPFLIGSTLCVGMNNPAGIRLPRRDGAMGIVDTKDWSFRFVRREDMPCELFDLP